MEFIGFADVNDFIKISGLSENDLEKKVLSNKEFQKECMYRFGKGNKRYIKVDKAINFIEKNLMFRETEIWNEVVNMRQELVAYAMVVAVSAILSTLMIFGGVYFTTLIAVILMASTATYYATHYVLNELKKTDSNGNC